MAHKQKKKSAGTDPERRLVAALHPRHEAKGGARMARLPHQPRKRADVGAFENAVVAEKQQLGLCKRNVRLYLQLEQLNCADEVGNLKETIAFWFDAWHENSRQCLEGLNLDGSSGESKLPDSSTNTLNSLSVVFIKNLAGKYPRPWVSRTRALDR